jgi:hypothetical protein
MTGRKRVSLDKLTASWFSLCVFSLCSLCLCGEFAFAGSPRLARISPPGGQRGTTVEVFFQGRYLEQPREVLLYEPGITVEAVELADTPQAEAGTRVRARLKLADDCPLGPHGLRLRTASGVTEYHRFFVGPYPTVEEEETPQKRNDKRETAKSVLLNSTILGRLGEAADIDCYRVEMQRGQRLSAEVEAARLGVDRGIPDLYLTIYDAEGKTVAAADDSALFLQDPILSIIADRDGAYFVEVRHNLYNGPGEVYRLHVGTFARPTGIYPAGGPAGSELTVQILGDPRGGWKQTVRLPAAPDGNFPFIAIDPESALPAPSPNRLRVSPFPNVLEVEPNDAPNAVASSVADLPAAFNGIINKAGDVDCFRFRAKKGQQLRFHALANALGSPVDPVIWIRPVNGKPNAPEVRATDSRANQLGVPPMGSLSRDTLDPVLDFTVPADGDYILGVENERGEGGSDFVYRVEVYPEVQAVYTYLPPEPENQQAPQARQAIAVAAGNRYNGQVAIFSTDRPFNGDLELHAVGLPAGVKLHAPKLTPGMTRIPFVFEAAADVKPQAALIDLIVRPTGENAPALVSGYRQLIPMNRYGNNDFYLQVVVDRLALVVTEPALYRIEVEELRSAVVQNGEMTLKFKVHRENGFDGPVTAQLEWRPTGVNTATPVTVAAGQTEGTYLLGAARNATAGSYQVALTAISGGPRQGYADSANRTYVSSQPFRLTVAEPHLEARFVRASVERGKTATLVCKLNHLKPFTGTAQATLGRLPRGVELVEPTRTITPEDKEVTFTLRATSESLVGNYQGIVLDVTVGEGGQSVRQLSGSGLLRIDAERGAKPKK